MRPAVAYAARPKAGPGDRAADTHNRVRTDIIGTTGTVTLRHAGKLYHIGVGRTAWRPWARSGDRGSAASSTPMMPVCCERMVGTCLGRGASKGYHLSHAGRA